MTPRDSALRLGRRRATVVLAAGVAVALTAAVLLLPSTASAAERPDLGAAGPFAVLAGGRVTGRGATGISGDVGVGPGQGTGGLAPERVNGAVHLGDDAWGRAHGDATRAFDALAGPFCDGELADGELGGKVLSPGTTCVPAAARLSQVMTLDGRGDPDAVFVLRIPESLSVDAGSAVVLVNGAQACNVVYRVGGSASLGRDSTVRGTVLAERTIGLGARTTLEGRALSRAGDVDLDASTITVPLCAAMAAPPAPPSPLRPAPPNPPAPLAAPSWTAPPLAPGLPLGTGPSPSSAPLGAPQVVLGGTGDDTEPPPTGAGAFPPDLAARRDSVQRSGPSTSQALLDALAPLGAYGLTPEQIAQVGFGRFPVAGYATYTHDWWFPRYGPTWRLHEGTDIFAAAGTPVRSPTEGTVRLVTGGLGGITVYVVEPNGTYYYLAHLAARAPGLVEGASVTTGQVVGFVGTSGNAVGTPPHLHFEVHPNGGGPVDPKPVLDQFLADARAASANLISAYAAAPSTVVDGTAASARLPAPGGAGSAAPSPVPTSTAAPGGGVPTSTLLWAVVAGLAGLLVSRNRGGDAVVVARAPAKPVVEERMRVRPTVRSLYRKWAARPTAPPASTPGARAGERRTVLAGSVAHRPTEPAAPPTGPVLAARVAQRPTEPAAPTTASPGPHLAECFPRSASQPAETASDYRAGVHGPTRDHAAPDHHPVGTSRWDLRPSAGASASGQVAEAALAVWATYGFGHPVPTASPAVVDKVLGLRPLSPRHAWVIRSMCEADDPIQPLLLPADTQRIYLTSAAVAALVTSGIPTLVCCATAAGAERLERVGGFEVLTGIPVLPTARLLEEMRAGGIGRFVEGTVVFVAEALQVPPEDLARLAGHLADSGGCMKLLLHPPEGHLGAPVGPELAPANGARRALPASSG